MTTTSNSSRTHSPANSVASILREAGYVPLPRLWVKSEDMSEIHAIAHRYQNEVNQLRNRVQSEDQSVYFVDQTDGELRNLKDHIHDPKLDRNAAWAAYETLRHTA